MATNPLGQSDQDFLNELPPVVDPADKAPNPAIPDEDAHNAGDPPVEDDDATKPGEDTGDDGDADADADAGSDDDDEGDKSTVDPKPIPLDPNELDPADKTKPKPKEPVAPVVDDDKSKAKPEEKPAVDDAKDKPGLAKVFQVPTEFVANGKTIKIKDDAEALKLMQMGANYTRKMQEIAPHRKVLMMLQNNGLMDEARLSFLIDLDKKNPDAIKQLIKDAGIDPMDIDTTADTNYLAGSHSVTEEEVGFRTTMEDLSSSDAGKATIASINSDFDDTSKEVLWKQPEIMTVIHEQRESGIYDQIKAEVDRQIAVGTIPAKTPFLAAYRQVGDEMVAAATASPPAGQQPTGATEGKPDLANPAPTPVVTRAAAPKAGVKNSDKAGAAASTRSSPTAAKVLINPLSLKDDDFLSQMENRV